jgi:ABC-type transport system substrate-binding protein/tetratricopeptide (TPR) repeat protein
MSAARRSSILKAFLLGVACGAVGIALSTPVTAQQRQAGGGDNGAQGGAGQGGAGQGGAKADVPSRLVDRDPFDRLVLDGANQNAVIEVFPIPEMRGGAKLDRTRPLRVRLISRPTQLYELNWSAVARIETHEEILVAEAEKLTTEKRFEEAFEYLDAIHRRDPKYPGLRKAVEVYLYLNAGHYFGKERYPEALSLLEELFRLNPSYKHANQTADLASAIARLIDQIMTRYMAKEDYVNARNMLIRVTNTYGDKQQATVEKWTKQLSDMAAGYRDKARQLAKDQRYREALPELANMTRVWPRVEGGEALVKEISERYPLVVVGVQQRAIRRDAELMDDWAARRTGRLVRRRLCEFVGKGPEGGRYESPLGNLEFSDDGRQITFSLRAIENADELTVNGYSIARRLAALADPNDPGYSPAWGSIVAGIAVQDVNQVRIDLRRPHALPPSLLQTTLDGPARDSTAAAGAVGQGASGQVASGQVKTANGPAANGAGLPSPDSISAGPYVPAEQTAVENRFLANRQYAFYQARQPKELVEKLIEKPDRAINALKRGEIDIYDRIFPADVYRLRNDSSIALGQYAVPTLHVLVPNYAKPYPANKIFRRALLYALNREGILRSELLGGGSLPGCAAISGPFPAGTGASDPLAYGYDERIGPRAYDPRLGLTLVKLAATELANQAKKANQPEPKLETIVIGYPPTEVARIAIQAIGMQLEVIKLKVELRELPPDKLSDQDGGCDFVYRELAVNEPLADAPKLLGVKGLFSESSPYVGLALRRLEATGNWQDASLALKDLHRITYDDVTVLPLWQLAEYYAYRKWLRGVGDQIVTLYQNVENWQIAPRIGTD